MNNYYFDKVIMKPIKIGSKLYIEMLKNKISNHVEKKEVMQNIEYDTYRKIKNTLPKLKDNQFYCHHDGNVLIKNRSIKLSDFSNHVNNKLPNIIDQIIETMNDSDITDIKNKIQNIFHNSLLH